MSDSYILNVNDGIDVLHRKDGLTESCNTDDSVGRETVDAETADALLVMDSARRCGHCWPED